MNLLRSLASAIAATVFALPGAAQRTVIVDAANGPGTNHTTLAAAFASLLANDQIVVKAGNYVGASLSTPLSFSLVGQGNPVVMPAGGGSTLQITMWGGAQQRVAIRGITVQRSTSARSRTTGRRRPFTSRTASSIRCRQRPTASACWPWRSG